MLSNLCIPFKLTFKFQVSISNIGSQKGYTDDRFLYGCSRFDDFVVLMGHNTIVTQATIVVPVQVQKPSKDRANTIQHF